jgi:hypothetical protein
MERRDATQIDPGSDLENRIVACSFDRANLYISLKNCAAGSEYTGVTASRCTALGKTDPSHWPAIYLLLYAHELSGYENKAKAEKVVCGSCSVVDQ